MEESCNRSLGRATRTRAAVTVECHPIVDPLNVARLHGQQTFSVDYNQYFRGIINKEQSFLRQRNGYSSNAGHFYLTFTVRLFYYFFFIKACVEKMDFVPSIRPIQSNVRADVGVVVHAHAHVQP